MKISYHDISPKYTKGLSVRFRVSGRVRLDILKELDEYFLFINLYICPK